MSREDGQFIFYSDKARRNYDKIFLRPFCFGRHTCDLEYRKYCRHCEKCKKEAESEQ